MVNKKGKKNKGKAGRKAGKKGAFKKDQHPRKANGQFKKRRK